MCTSEYLKALGKEIRTFYVIHLIKYPTKEFWRSINDTDTSDNVFATLTLKLVLLSITIFFEKNKLYIYIFYDI